MTEFSKLSYNRRQVLRNGGIVLSLGAIVAACSNSDNGSDAPGRLGVADEALEEPTAELNDAVLLRTAQSLEYTVLAIYEGLLESGAFSSEEASLVDRFVADHKRHADEIGELVGSAGGEPFTCENPFLMERAVAPILAAFGESSDQHRDALNIAFSFESMAAATYQSLVSSLEDLPLRAEVMRVCGEENRHAAVVAALINPDELVSPAVSGEPVDNDADGFPVAYAIPSVFGQLTGIVLVVGDVDDDGARYSTILQTPAENTYVYDFESCDQA